MPHVIDPKQKNKVPKKGSLHQICTPYFVTSDDYTLFAESVQKLQPVQNDGGQRLFEQLKQDQTGLDRSARSTLDFGVNTVKRYI